MKRYVIGLVLRIIFRAEITGAENIPDEGGVILAANHLSALDPLLLATFLRRQIAFGAKAELFKGRLSGWFFRAIQQIPVKRDGSVGDFLVFCAEAERWLEEGEVFGIFPEGTRSSDGCLGELHRGVLRIAFMSGAPIVPVGIQYRWWLTVRISIGKPIQFEKVAKLPSRSQQKQLLEELATQLRQLSGQAVPSEPAVSVK